jgi:hypothetical protein
MAVSPYRYQSALQIADIRCVFSDALKVLLYIEDETSLQRRINVSTRYTLFFFKYYRTLMKLLLLALLTATAANQSNAQSCTSFYYMQNNKTVTMSLTNGKGKETGKYIYKVSDVKTEGSALNSTVESSVLDDKGKKIGGSMAHMRCIGGVYYSDMKMMMPPQQAGQMKDIDATSKFSLEYPAAMQVGEALKDGGFIADIASGNGMDMEMEMEVSERKVEGEESVTTAAGTWKCYRIHANIKIITRIAGVGVPMNMATTEWFAPGFGIVRSESKWGKTELVSIQ